MNNENEIEEMAKVMQDDLFQWDSDAQDLTNSLAETLCEKGYGNVKRAVKEFGEDLKDFIFQNSSIGCITVCGEEYPVSQLSCSPEALESEIDNLITELYGADE